MEDKSSIYQEFCDYANSFGRGHLKFHKAVTLIMIIDTMPQIMVDRDRFLNLLKNSLGMEGFSESDIETILNWLYENLK